jgi:hypothetical protein
MRRNDAGDMRPFRNFLRHGELKARHFHEAREPLGWRPPPTHLARDELIPRYVA